MRISDWSSDVCSSDLRLGAAAARAGRRTLLLFMGHYVIKVTLQHSDLLGTLDSWRWGLVAWVTAAALCVVASLPKPDERLRTPLARPQPAQVQNGRASCRERVCQSV